MTITSIVFLDFPALRPTRGQAQCSKETLRGQAQHRIYATEERDFTAGEERKKEERSVER
jgi:hypothetical protein